MSKKDEAFELFAQGKGPKDPEVAALGLAESSRVKYHRLWLKHNKPVEPEVPVAAVPAPVTQVPLSTIKDGKFFVLYGGAVYRRDNRARNSDLIFVRTAEYVAGGQRIDGVSIRAFKPDTMVTPK